MSLSASDPLQSKTYQVFVNGREIDVYGAKSCQPPWPFTILRAGEHPGTRLIRPDAPYGPTPVGEAGNAPYAFAYFSIESPAVVEIVSSLPLDRVRIRPEHPSRPVSVTGNRLRIELDGPAHLSIEPAGRHGGLLLFADAPETEIPDADDPRVHYYGPGLHRAGVIRLAEGETLYLAPGAIVEGGVCVENAANVRMIGRGILCGDPWAWRDGPQKDMVMFTESSGIHVEGIILRCSWQWTFRMTGCQKVTIRNVKLCGGKNLNDDGLDPSSCQEVLIEGCFIRTQDDNISIKAHCDDRRPCEKITIRHCLLWSDLARVLMVGPETYADRIGDVHLHDCEVLFLGYPARISGFCDADEASPAFGFVAGEDCLMESIAIENVVIHITAERDGYDLIRLETKANGFMRRPVPGQIRNIGFRNITVIGEPCTPAIRMAGDDAQHRVEGIRFENVEITGRPLGADYPGLEVGGYAEPPSFGGSDGG